MWGLPAYSVKFEVGDQDDNAGESRQAMAIAGG